MLRFALSLACLFAVIGGIVAAINGVVDPKNEFYSGEALTAALRSSCLIGDDVVHARSYPEFKQDLFERRRTSAVLLSSDVRTARNVNLGFPGFGPDALLDTMRFLSRAQPRGRLSVYIETDATWFDPAVRPGASDTSVVSEAGYLLSPWTLKSSLDLMRRSRTLAFTGWQKEAAGPTCVVDRGSPSPAWRPDGTLVGATPVAGRTRGTDFAWHRLTPVDAALAIARARGWRVVGFSAPSATSDTYERELRALFAKHGYRWRIRRMRL